MYIFLPAHVRLSFYFTGIYIYVCYAIMTKLKFNNLRQNTQIINFNYKNVINK